MRKFEACLYTTAITAVCTGVVILLIPESLFLAALCAAVAVFFGLGTIVAAIERATIILQETLETLKEE